MMLLAFVHAGCSSDPAPRSLSPTERAELRPVSEMVTGAGDVFTQEAAAKVAREYFHTFFGDCGGVGVAEERADAWHFPTVIGFAAEKGPDIVVAKSGAWVFSKGGAVVHWVAGRWMFDTARYRTFFHNDES